MQNRQGHGATIGLEFLRIRLQFDSISILTAICFVLPMDAPQIRKGGLEGGLRIATSQAEGRGFDPRLPLQTCPSLEDTISVTHSPETAVFFVEA